MKTLAHILIIVFVIATLFVIKDDVVVLWDRAKEGVAKYLAERDILSLPEHLNEQKQNVRLPGPLKELTDREADEAYLTKNGIITQTNEQRAQQDLPPLEENSLLNQTASLKVADMFENGYFEHIAPDGTGVGDLGDTVNYDYITIGENLAQGNFSNDVAVVNAWMNSEGHRANILHNRYTEIGVAVQKGEYNGQTIWMAVQHFGLPRTECPEVNEQLRSQITVNQEELDDLEQTIVELRTNIENMEKSNPEYNSSVDEHNRLVGEYNTLIQNTKGMVDTYNEQVRSYNACAEDEE